MLVQIFHKRAPHLGTMQRRLIVSALSVFLYLLCLWLIAICSPLNHNFTQTGWQLLFYNAGRLFFMAAFLTMLLTCGALIYRLLPIDKRAFEYDTTTFFICAGFLGASALALLMIIVGFLQLYTPMTALLISVPCIAAAPFLIGDAVSAHVRSALASMQRYTPIHRACLALLALCAVAGGAALLIGKGLAPEQVDGDVWEHYLHYYQAVLDQGGIWPNDVWYHFYLSKGAGLFFLSMLLTDVMAASLVSSCFVLLAAVVVYDLVRRYTKNVMWGLLAVVLFLLFMAVNSPIIASFSKHHVVLMAYLVFVFWAGMRLLSAPTSFNARVVLVAACAGCFYITFYIPVATALLLASCGGAWIVQCCFAPRHAFRGTVLVLCGAIVGGLAVVLTLNYAVTGMPEMVPTDLMWRLADKQRFDLVWDRNVIDFFLMEEQPTGCRPVTLADFANLDAQWILYLCRGSYFKRFAAEATPVYLGMALLFYVCSRRSVPGEVLRLRLPLLRRLKLVAMSAGFLAGLLFVAQGFPNQPSLGRMFSFTAPFIVMGFVTFWSCIFRPMPPGKVMLGTVAVLLAIIQPAKSLYHSFPLTGFMYAGGKISASDAFRAADRHFRRGTDVDDYYAAGQCLHGANRMCRLTYDSGPGYFIPGKPVVSEPTYAFGGEYATVLFGDAKEAESVLRRLRVTQFTIDLRSPLFVGLPFSDLFRAADLSDRFRLVFHRDEFYVFTWRDNERSERLPERLLEVLEIKQNNCFADVFRDEFGVELGELARREMEERGAARPAVGEVVEPGLVADVARSLLERKLLDNMECPETRRLMLQLIDELEDAVRVEAALGIKDFFASGAARDPGTVIDHVSVRVVARIREGIREFSEARWGGELGTLICDRGWYFGSLYNRMRAAHLATLDPNGEQRKRVARKRTLQGALK